MLVEVSCSTSNLFVGTHCSRAFDIPLTKLEILSLSPQVFAVVAVVSPENINGELSLKYSRNRLEILPLKQ